ncbi:MAG: hypothetical protein HC902_05685 [Calothrix sp. SM1_5_4]|nr:hypothetical protein [Calothrix sp. SM1_5_4]
MEYSAKYRVSLSTLRRRIKAGEIEYKSEGGKYLLKDGPLQLSQPGSETIAPPSSVSSQTPVAVPAKSDVDPDQFWRATQGLLNEIKKAYSLVLQEKEQQILQLKEEVADLKTLVRVLEEDNNRMKAKPASLTADFDLGLEV